MDLNQLRSFVAVAHQGNLTQAAENLHLSQPAVSAQIKAIERHLDVQLFERNAQGMSLTAAGSALLPEAEALLRHMHRLDYFAAGLSAQHTDVLEIGIIHPLSSKKTALLAKRLQDELPGVRCTFRFGLSGDIINAVRKKELHAGFFLGANPYRSVEAVPLERVDYVLICHAAEAGRLRADFPKSLNRCNWIAASAASGSSKYVQQFWRQLKIAPPGHMECDRPSVMIDMVAQELGVAFVPRRSAEKALESGLPVVLLEEAAGSIELSFVYPAEYEENPLVGVLAAAVAQIWPVAGG